MDAQNFGVFGQHSQLKILPPCVRSPWRQTTGVSVARHRISTQGQLQEWTEHSH
jgi:hypothetical protein